MDEKQFDDLWAALQLAKGARKNNVLADQLKTLESRLEKLAEEERIVPPHRRCPSCGQEIDSDLTACRTCWEGASEPRRRELEEKAGKDARYSQIY